MSSIGKDRRKIGSLPKPRQPTWTHRSRQNTLASMWKMSRVWLPVLLAIQSCGPDRTDDSASTQPAAESPRPDSTLAVTATEYSTTLLFLPLEAGQTRAVVLEFANLATSDALEQRYQAWELTASGWRAILDLQSSEAPLREPWRLFPSDSLRVTVTADGDADAVIIRGAGREYALELGEHFDRWEDRAGTQHDIREAFWISRGQRISGIAVQHRFAIPEPQIPARFGSYQRAILRSEDGAVIAFFSSPDAEKYGNSFAWMYADGLTRRWTALESRNVEVTPAPQLRRNVPIRTWFRIPEPDIGGEITVAERLFSDFPAEQGPRPYNALYRVRGWIEFAGERRTVEGLLERGEV